MKYGDRLRHPEHFQRVRREGRTFSHPLLLLNVAPNRRSHARCGFVVGKRIGKAVARNRAKRRVREAVRLLFDSLAPGMDLVFVVRSAAVAHVSFRELQAAVESLLHRAALWGPVQPPKQGQTAPPR